MRRGIRARLRGRWPLVLVGAVCLSALLVEALLLPAGPGVLPPASTTWSTGPYVTVLDVDLIATYTSASNDTSFLSQSDCGCGPLNLTPGASFGWWIRLANSDPVNHTLLRISLDSPFTLVTAAPQTPVTLPAAGNVTITMSIQVPANRGDYVVTGAVWVS